MLEYIVSAFIAWFVGFFPYFEIYIAIPAGIAAGLSWFSAFVWATLGNWMVIPFIDVTYEKLLRLKFMQKVNEKANSPKLKEKIDKYGGWFVLLFTPMLGVWTIAVVAKIFQLERKRLYIFSAVSVSIIGFTIAGLLKLGIANFA